MGNTANKVDDQLIKNSTLMITSLNPDTAKKKKALAKAAALKEVANMMGAVAESAEGGNVTSGAPAANYGGKYFHLDNGIPEGAILAMLKNNTENQDAQYESIRQTAMVKGGLAKDPTTGAYTITGDSLVMQEASTITTSFTNQAQSLQKDGTKGMIQGFSGLAGEGLSEATAGKTEDEDENIDKISNALEAEKKIPVAPTFVMDSAGNKKLDAAGKPIANQSRGVKRAIQALSTGNHDVTETGNHFGSKLVETGRKKKLKIAFDDQATHKDDFEIDTGTTGNVKVIDALRGATEEQRSAIRGSLQKQLKEAKSLKRKAEDKIENRRAGKSRAIAGLTSGAASGIDLSKTINTAAQGQAEALKVVTQNENQTMQSVSKNEGDGADAAKKNSSTTMDLLRTMLGQQGRRA